MSKMYFLRIFMCFLLMGSISQLYAQYPAGSPVATNGKLKVSGKNLVNECDQVVQLKGMSTHGLQWFESCVNTNSLDALVKDWKGNVFRLAMYIQESGYQTNPTKWKTYIDNLVDECGKRGIYCIIDWHVLTPGDPNASITDAKEFWTYMSKKHAGKKHVLYEICNEPNGVDWARVKTYADDIIKNVIRPNDPSTIIIVGTPNWSQDVDEAAKNKITVSTNIMYGLHFYAATHKQSLRDKANTAIAAGLALFVTEWGTSEASGTAAINLAEAGTWMTWVDNNKISWCNWSYADKAEAAASLKPGSCAANTYTNTTESGTFVKGKMGGSLPSCSTIKNIPPPVVDITAPANNGSFISPATVVLTATATTGSGTITKVEFFNGSTSLGSVTSAPFTYNWTNAPVGTYYIKAVATTSEGITGTSSGVNVFVNVPQAPYGTEATKIAGTKVKIEAENYDKGGNNNAYYDLTTGNSGPATYRPSDDVDIEGTGPNYTIGYTNVGEWLEYTIDVQGTAVHSIGVNVASQPGGKIHVEVDGVDVTKAITVPAGSWTSWSTITVTNINLTYGIHVVRLVFDTPDVNADFLEITRTGVVTNVLTSDGSAGSTLYPNPSNSTFMLEAINDINNIAITNLFGQVVERRENISAGTPLEVGAALETGTYLMKVEYASGKTQTIKMTKVK